MEIDEKIEILEKKYLINIIYGHYNIGLKFNHKLYEIYFRVYKFSNGKIKKDIGWKLNELFKQFLNIESIIDTQQNKSQEENN